MTLDGLLALLIRKHRPELRRTDQLLDLDEGVAAMPAIQSPPSQRRQGDMPRMKDAFAAASNRPWFEEFARVAVDGLAWEEAVSAATARLGADEGCARDGLRVPA